MSLPKNRNTEIVNELFKKPRKDRGVNAPTFQRYPKNLIHQADLLFLPDDDGYKYALVVVDIGTRLTDAEPIKDKTSAIVAKAFEKIYKRKILSMPKKIEVDPGTEFQGATKQFFDSNDIVVHVGKPNRHRQQAIVERRNQMIGKELFMRMTSQELQTGVVSREWADDLPVVIKNMNAKTRKKQIRTPDDEYKCAGDACTLLSEGMSVRVALDAPIDVASGKKLHGKFRDSDIRYEIKPKKIAQVIIQPNQPPLYLVDDGNGKTDHRQAYTKSQLLPVSANEKPAQEKDIRPIKKDGQDLYIIEKILDRKKVGNKIMFVVKWKGFKDTTLEPRTTLIHDVPDLVEEFEKR